MTAGGAPSRVEIPPAGGVLPIDKPAGPTSHDVVALVRRALRIRQVGHTGTLDPFASGLLLVCLGPATRLAEYLTAMPKRYLATLKLGESTDTDDLQGEVVGGSSWTGLDASSVRDALERQTGRRMQLPPRYSAKKVDGVRMYEAARRGDEPVRSPVEVRISRIEVLRVELPHVTFEVDCSAGTYIRAIARDAGESLGVGAHLTELRRTRVGERSVDHAVSLQTLRDDPSAALAALLPPAAAVDHLPAVTVGEAEAGALAHGRALPAPDSLPEDVPVALLSSGGALLAIGSRSGPMLKPRKVFA